MTLSNAIMLVTSSLLLACGAPKKENLRPSTDSSDVKAIGGSQMQGTVEDSVAHKVKYNGTYKMIERGDGTEPQYAYSSLKIEFKDHQSFNYTWSLDYNAEENRCHVEKNGTVMLDVKNYGVDSTGTCKLHFNFYDTLVMYSAVRIKFDEQAICQELKECDFPPGYSSTLMKHDD